jgi:hypothetical protein
VLKQMVRREKLTQTQFDALSKKPLRIDFERQTEPPGPAPHFARQLRKWLIAWADRNDYSIYGDGLVVRTTIDSRLQAAANQAVTRQGNSLQNIANAAWGKRSAWSTDSSLVQAFIRESPEYAAAIAKGRTPEQATAGIAGRQGLHARAARQKTQIQIGFLAIDPRNGHVKAWVGSRDFEQDAFDHVQQARRQPGSTFKPFVYGEAFRQGASPDDRLIDQAVEIDVGGAEVWRPTDGTPPSGEAMSLSDGLAYSKNTITAQLIQQVGPAKVAKLARHMGVRQSKLEAVPSLALGTSPVTLKEMVAAYGTIANGGGYLEPLLVSRIEDRDGRVIEEFSPPAPDSRARARRRLHAARQPARRHQPRHRQRYPQPLRHPRRRRRQDRHDAGQRRRLVHPDAPAVGGRGMGRFQRQPRHAAQRLLGAGGAQRPAGSRRLLPECLARPPHRSACPLRGAGGERSVGTHQELVPEPLFAGTRRRTQATADRQTRPKTGTSPGTGNACAGRIAPTSPERSAAGEDRSDHEGERRSRTAANGSITGGEGGGVPMKRGVQRFSTDVWPP